MNLKMIALATTALVGIAAAPAQAGQYMGKMNLGLGYVWEDYDHNNGSEDKLDYSSLHGSGSVNIPYSDRVNLQLDIFGEASLDENQDDGGELNGSYHGGFGAGAHVNYNDPAVGGLGIFAAVGRVNVGGDSSSDGVVFAAGLEGQYYCNVWTLSAQAGYMDSDTNIWGLVKDAGFLHAGVAYYASNKLKLSGGVGYLAGQTSHSANPDDISEWNWGLGVEYLFGKTIPVSTYLEYKGRHLEEFSNPTYDLDRHEVRVGVRFLFGGGDDLQRMDREGPGFESPDLITWAPHEYP